MALRIKDSINLKELEKFGFEYRNIGNRWTKNLYVYGVFGYRNSMSIKIGAEIIVYNQKGLDILFDLIQAGLVEKVEVQDDRKE